MTFDPSRMRLYSDLERAYYEELRDIYSQQNIPDFSREVIFLEDAGYYCIYKDEFDAYQKMKAWVLSEGGWVQTEYSVYDPVDAVHLINRSRTTDCGSDQEIALLEDRVAQFERLDELGAPESILDSEAGLVQRSIDTIKTALKER